MNMQIAGDVCICSFTSYMNAFVPTEAISVMADLISIIMHMHIIVSSRQWSN